MVSRIIHQTAPSDKKRWHPIWSECQNLLEKKLSQSRIYLYVLG